MRKILFALIAIVLVIFLVFFMLREEQVDDNNLIDQTEELVEVLPFVPELKVMTYGFNKTFEIDETEVEAFKDHLVRIEFLSDVYRLSYLYDSENNELSLIYKDQTIDIDMNSNNLYYNGLEMENTLVISKAGSLYVDLEVFSNWFSVTYDWADEPYFIARLDFDSENQVYNDTEKNMIFINETLPEKINMTWEAVYSGGTNVDKLYEMPGLDVISPVWYTLEDSKGSIASRKQDDYIIWAQEMRYTLWPAVTNDFDLDKTHEMLISRDNRRAFIENIVRIYKENDFPGINIDFENIYKEDKDLLSHFIAELTAACHREQIIISMDVTFLGGSDTWSLCYDRQTLAEFVDFIVVMSYDEHWGSSPVSGSVASLNWVDRNLALLLREVPSEKLIMGIPFYMRVWFERPSTEKVNRMRVTSDAITMHAMESILENGNYKIMWDQPAGQHFISFIDAEDQALKKVWIENKDSLELKVDLVHKYNLKGVASWRRGYETEDIWPMIDEVLNR